MLAETDDGGRSWRRVRLRGQAGDRVVAVSGRGSREYAALLSCPDIHHCTRVRLFTTAVGSGRWHRLSLVLPRRDESSGLTLAAAGRSVWLLLGVPGTDPVTLRSVDGGDRFTRVGSVGGIACTGSVGSVGSGRVLWSTCATGTDAVVRRTEGVRTRLAEPFEITRTGLDLDPLDDRLAFLGTAFGPRSGLRLTADGGRHYTFVARWPRRFLKTAGGFAVSFLDRRVGLAVVYDGGFYRTTDGGRTWRPDPG